MFSGWSPRLAPAHLCLTLTSDGRVSISGLQARLRAELQPGAVKCSKVQLVASSLLQLRVSH